MSAASNKQQTFKLLKWQLFYHKNMSTRRSVKIFFVLIIDTYTFSSTSRLYFCVSNLLNFRISRKIHLFVSSDIWFEVWRIRYLHVHISHFSVTVIKINFMWSNQFIFAYYSCTKIKHFYYVPTSFCNVVIIFQYSFFFQPSE